MEDQRQEGCAASYVINTGMDARGRWADNVISERLWRTLKYVGCPYGDMRVEESLGQRLTTARGRIRAWTLRLPMLSMRGDASLYRERYQWWSGSLGIR